MQNGGLEQLISNPMLRQMAENFGQSGQMPDVSSLMNNPQLRQCVSGAHSLTQNGSAVHGQHGPAALGAGGQVAYVGVRLHGLRSGSARPRAPRAREPSTVLATFSQPVRGVLGGSGNCANAPP